MSEKRVREAQFWALGFSHNRQKGHAAKNLAEALQTEAVTHKLSVGREVQAGIPVNFIERLLPWNHGPRSWHATRSHY